MKRLICNIWTLLLLATIFTGCSESDDTFYNKGAVRVDLAFTLSGPAANKTRMSDDVVQTSEARDYDILYIIPMIDNMPDINLLAARPRWINPHPLILLPNSTIMATATCRPESINA